MAKLGTVYVHVEKEDPTYSVQATTYPVEKGIAYTDHIKRDADTYNITGTILGSDAMNRLQALKTYMDKGTVINYSGRFIFRNVIIKRISPSASTIKNGMEVSIELQQMRIVTSSYVPKKATPSTVKQKPKTNSGKKQVATKTTITYHVIKKGDMYWSLAKKYGTSIAALRKLNPKVNENKLQIGSKVRVK